MKRLALSLLLLMYFAQPISAVSATPSATATASGKVKGIYDDPFASEYSDTSTATATATPRPTPSTRTTLTSTANTPVAGVLENTIILLMGGMFLIVLGYRFTKA